MGSLGEAQGNARKRYIEESESSLEKLVGAAKIWKSRCDSNVSEEKKLRAETGNRKEIHEEMQVERARVEVAGAGAVKQEKAEKRGQVFDGVADLEKWLEDVIREYNANFKGRLEETTCLDSPCWDWDFIQDMEAMNGCICYRNF